MNFSQNYYKVLDISIDADAPTIKKSYYKLSFSHHPDKGGDPSNFALINEAYRILSDPESRSEYDHRSKWGKDYDELYELLNFEFKDDSKIWDKNKYDEFKKNQVLNIVIHVNDDFNGKIEYQRWVTCKKCKGSGKDTESRIEIRDQMGKIIRTFDGEDGCDFCEGSGEDRFGNPCAFCAGLGKIGSVDCKICKGEKRILGKQKLSGIILKEDEKSKRIDYMGHVSKDSPGKCGHLWIIQND